jgi:hypothetical protein
MPSKTRSGRTLGDYFLNYVLDDIVADLKPGQGLLIQNGRVYRTGPKIEEQPKKPKKKTKRGRR